MLLYRIPAGVTSNSKTRREEGHPDDTIPSLKMLWVIYDTRTFRQQGVTSYNCRQIMHGPIKFGGNVSKSGTPVLSTKLQKFESELQVVVNCKIQWADHYLKAS